MTFTRFFGRGCQICPQLLPLSPRTDGDRKFATVKMMNMVGSCFLGGGASSGFGISKDETSPQAKHHKISLFSLLSLLLCHGQITFYGWVTFYGQITFYCQITFYGFWLIFTMTIDNNNDKIIQETCFLWDIDYNSDNWEPEFMTITLQLRVTLDSIHNSCDVSMK